MALLYRSASTQSVDNLPAASKIEQKTEEIIPCHICERNKDKEETTAADMYCYNCDNVFCDEHSGVSKTFHLILYLEREGEGEREILYSVSMLCFIR